MLTFLSYTTTKLRTFKRFTSEISRQDKHRGRSARRFLCFLCGITLLVSFCITAIYSEEPDALAARWAIPKTRLPNLPSVHKFLPPRNANESDVESVRIDLPGFKGHTNVQPTDDVPLQPPTAYGSDANNPLAPKNRDVNPLTDSIVFDHSGNSDMYFQKRSLVDPVSITAKTGWNTQINNVDVYFLEGECTVRQNSDCVQGAKAVVWIDNRSSPKNTCVYLESADPSQNLFIEMNQNQSDAKINDNKWLGTFQSTKPIEIFLENRSLPQKNRPEIYSRAEEMRFPGVKKYRPAQLQQAFNLEGKKVSFRSIEFSPRNDSKTEASLQNDPNTNRSVVIISNGFNIIIRGIEIDGQGEGFLTGDIVDITADKAVIWTPNIAELFSRNDKRQPIEEDFEIYLEGNIEFREGRRTIYAKKMYYDAKNKIGYVLGAELLSPATGYDGLVRLKAEVLQQTGAKHFIAKNAFVTTSRLGQPSYRLQSNRMTLDEIGKPLFDSQTGAALVDVNGNPMEKKRQLLVSENNVICLGPVPVFYWPWMAADLQYKDPFLYLRDARFGHDKMFGTQVRTTWNPYQIFNIQDPPDGTTWDLSLDYLSARGFGHGTNFTYSRPSFLGFNGPTAGMVDFWGVYDHGNDNLGWDRRDLEPEESYRYRAFWRHRQTLTNHWVATAELGKTSDRNFMEQYFEKEWDTLKNQSTDLELKKTDVNRSLSIFASYKLDDHVTDTNWLPRGDHHWIGQSLLEDRLTWYEHTTVGLAQFKTGSVPGNINTNESHNENYYYYLPWELAPGSSNDPNNPNFERLEAFREVFSTKHELDLPFSVGPVKFVPYILGEFAHWGEDVNGDSVQRLYYQGGIRTTLPMWKLMPGYRSRTWYANGLAHKVDFTGEFLFARSNVNWDRLVQYNALDDYSVQNFRRRYTYTTYGGNVPVQFDERYYAIRSGLASNVSSPVTELADDLTLLRFGMKNRWQTKRGPSGNQRIIDWITLDTHINIYPQKEHNYGESIGLIDYDFRWHVGDRFAILSSGIYDVFSNGQKITRLGGITERPGRGSLFLGIDRLDGPFTATYLNLNLDYVMTEKYSGSFGTSYDLSAGKSAGTHFSVTRTGESFALSLTTSVDPSRDVWGVSFSIRPVFLAGFMH